MFDSGGSRRTRTVELRGLDQPDDKRLHASFSLRYRYDYADGQPTRTNLYTGDADIVRVDRADPSEAQGLALLGEFNTFEPGFRTASSNHPGAILAAKLAVNVRVKGGHAFIARYGDGLRVVDVSDPTAMRAVGHAPVVVAGEIFNDVKLFEASGRTFAAMSASRSGMPIYDVTDPSAPMLVSNLAPSVADLAESVNDHTAFMVGTTAYLGMAAGLKPGGGGGLLIVDLSEPAKPRELGRWLAGSLKGNYVHDLFVEDGVAYLASWELGLVILDVRDPGKPQLVGRFTYERMTSHSVSVVNAGGRRVAVHGDEDFGAHVRTVDVDPASPTFLSPIGEWRTRPEVSVHNIMAAGEEIVMSHYQDGIRVLDVSDPAKPRQTAYFNTWTGRADPRNGQSFYEGAIGVDVVGSRIYVADSTRGLLVLERRH